MAITAFISPPHRVFPRLPEHGSGRADRLRPGPSRHQGLKTWGEKKEKNIYIFGR